MFWIVALLLTFFILAGKAIGWLIGSAWDLLWLLVILAILAGVYDFVKRERLP